MTKGWPEFKTAASATSTICAMPAAKDSGGATALFIASQNGHLADHGAQVDLPLRTVACQNGHPQIAEAPLAFGAVPNVVRKQHFTMTYPRMNMSTRSCEMFVAFVIVCDGFVVHSWLGLSAKAKVTTLHFGSVHPKSLERLGSPIGPGCLMLFSLDPLHMMRLMRSQRKNM